VRWRAERSPRTYRNGRPLLPAAAACVAFLWIPATAGAHPITGGPASGAQVIVMFAGLASALAGWLLTRARRKRTGTPSRLGNAMLLVGLLVFIAGPDIAGAISQVLFPPPATSVRLEVFEPRDGQLLSSNSVPVSVRFLSGPAGSVAQVPPAHGNIHIAVDGRLVSTSWQPALAVRVPPGTHTLTVEYVAADHRPFSPPVSVSRRITIQLPGGAGPAARAAAPAPAAPRTEAVLRWSDWTWDPPIVMGLALSAALYLRAERRFPPRGRQPLYFWAGLLTLALALLSPLDRGAAYLFTLHMAQHMLLLLVAPPLLALGTPPGVLGWLYQRPPLWRVLRTAWSPIPAFLAFNGVLVFWHLPFAYDATLRYAWVHAVEHLSFIAAGLMFWGVIVSPAPKLVRAPLGLRFGLVVAADVINFLVGFTLVFAGRPLYRAYTEVPRLWGLTPQADLQLGGALMWTMGQMMYAIPVLILLNVLLRREGAPPGGPDRAGRRPALG